MPAAEAPTKGPSSSTGASLIGAEQRDARPEEDRHEVDVHLVQQARVKALAGDLAAVDAAR